MPEDGAQGVGKGEVGPDIDLHLVDAGQFILHRVFHGNDVLFHRVEIIQRPVEGGGFAAAGGAGDQDDLVGPGEMFHEQGALVGLKTHLLQVEAHGALVQQPHHHLFPGAQGQDGNPHVKLLAGDGQLKATILGLAPFADIEMGHDLDAGDEIGVHLQREEVGLAEDAVHPGADPYSLMVRLDVDVAGPLPHSLEQDIIDGADRGGFFPGLFKPLLALDGRGVQPVHGGDDLRFDPYADYGFVLDVAADLVHGEDVERVGKGDQHLAWAFAQGEDLVFSGDGLGKDLGHFRVHHDPVEIDKGDFQLPGNGVGHGGIVDKAQFAQGLAQFDVAVGAVGQGLLQLGGGDQPAFHQDVAEFSAFRWCCHRQRRGWWFGKESATTGKAGGLSGERLNGADKTVNRPRRPHSSPPPLTKGD